VFEEYDRVTVRSYDPELIAAIRKVTSVRSPPVPIITPFRWVPTEKGLAVGTSNCGSCHTRYEPDGKRINGPQLIFLGGRGNAVPSARQSGRPGSDLRATDVVASAPFHMLEPLGTRYYRAYGVPWIKGDVHEALKDMLPDELQLLNALVARWNGSPYYPSKTLDLIGVKDRKYLDATGTHLNRDIGDLMRYAALVSFAESSDFGPHHMLTAGQKKIEARLPDEALYALALYIQSLKPPANPNASDETAAAGKKIFEREGCGGCHTPGLYTNNKLTLATGFKPPLDKPATLDILAVSVGTDSNLALKTRKGTGYY
jgi:mono/diheme cytochrome c family protein